jgi:hypothetical protein
MENCEPWHPATRGPRYSRKTLCRYGTYHLPVPRVSAVVNSYLVSLCLAGTESSVPGLWELDRRARNISRVLGTGVCPNRLSKPEVLPVMRLNSGLLSNSVHGAAAHVPMVTDA